MSSMKNQPDKTIQYSKWGMIGYFLKGSKRYFAVSIISAMLVSLADLINPKIIQFTVDSVIGESESSAPAFINAMIDRLGGLGYFRSHLILIAGVVILIALIGAVFRYLFKLYETKGAERLVQRMRNELFRHIERLPYAWHAKNHTGDIIQRCTSDVETVKVFVSEQLTSLFRVILLIVLSMYFMIETHLILALVAGAFIPVMILGSLFFYSRIGGTFAKVDAEEGRLSSIAQENLTGVRVVRAFGREAYEKERFEKQNHAYTRLWYRLMKILATFWVSGNVIATVRTMTVTVLGALFCVQGSLTAGGFLAFISYNSLISLPVRGLGRVISEMSRAGISIDRIRYIMNSGEEDGNDPYKGTPESESPEYLPQTVKKDRQDFGQGIADPVFSGRTPVGIFKGDIVFDHVSFTYDDGTAEVLDDVSFTVRHGTTLGILGETGSGKSTLMYLLDRLYDLPPGNGHIFIGGRDIQSIDRHELRKNIGMVLQEPYLFSRTLSENIRIASEEAGMNEIRAAAHLASLDQTIERFSEGYETYVGERGVTLSGGQKQRTAIAQMLIRRPPVMVFDDSFSAVDAETDAKIRASLVENLHDTTTILIAHRITTLMEADEIIVLDEGKIVQRGTHAQLLAEPGMYRDVYQLQTGEEA